MGAVVTCPCARHGFRIHAYEVPGMGAPWRLRGLPSRSGRPWAWEQVLPRWGLAGRILPWLGSDLVSCPSPDPALWAPLAEIRWLAGRCSVVCAGNAPPLLQSLPCNLSPTVWSPNTSPDFQRSFTDYKLRSDTLSVRVTIPQRQGRLARTMEEGTEVWSSTGTSLCERGGSHSMNQLCPAHNHTGRDTGGLGPWTRATMPGPMERGQQTSAQGERRLRSPSDLIAHGPQKESPPSLPRSWPCDVP